MGIDVNTQDPQQWQKSAVSSHDVGDGFIMRDRQADTVDLQFYYPGPTNFFVDAMCIPKVGQNEKLAEIFINYLVYENDTYRENMGEDVLEILYPEIGSFSELYNQYTYRNLSPELLENLNTLWETVKINCRNRS